MLGKKKGAIGSTISWMATTFIIFFLMVFLVGFTSLIYVTKGTGSFELQNQAAAMGPAELNSFLNYLQINNSDGKTNLDKIKEEDFSSFDRDFYGNPVETKKLLGVDCLLVSVYLNNVYKYSSSGNFLAGASLAKTEANLKQVYILTNTGNMVNIKYYGGKCLT